MQLLRTSALETKPLKMSKVYLKTKETREEACMTIREMNDKVCSKKIESKDATNCRQYHKGDDHGHCD